MQQTRPYFAPYVVDFEWEFFQDEQRRHTMEPDTSTRNRKSRYQSDYPVDTSSADHYNKLEKPIDKDWPLLTFLAIAAGLIVCGVLAATWAGFITHDDDRYRSYYPHQKTENADHGESIDIPKNTPEKEVWTAAVPGPVPTQQRPPAPTIHRQQEAPIPSQAPVQRPVLNLNRLLLRLRKLLGNSNKVSKRRLAKLHSSNLLQLLYNNNRNEPQIQLKPSPTSNNQLQPQPKRRSQQLRLSNNNSLSNSNKLNRLEQLRPQLNAQLLLNPSKPSKPNRSQHPKNSSSAVVKRLTLRRSPLPCRQLLAPSPLRLKLLLKVLLKALLKVLLKVFLKVLLKVLFELLLKVFLKVLLKPAGRRPRRGALQKRVRQVGYCFCGAHGPIDADYGVIACQRCKHQFYKAYWRVQQHGRRCRRPNCGGPGKCTFHTLLRLEQIGMQPLWIPRN
ncbi:unnamed protein product, partial [Mesorhabditis spiculigera]